MSLMVFALSFMLLIDDMDASTARSWRAFSMRATSSADAGRPFSVHVCIIHAAQLLPSGVVTVSVASVCTLCMFVCMSVCQHVILSVCNTITWESLGIESLCLVCRYIVRGYGTRSCTKVIGPRSRSQNQKSAKIPIPAK